MLLLFDGLLLTASMDAFPGITSERPKRNAAAAMMSQVACRRMDLFMVEILDGSYMTLARIVTVIRRDLTDLGASQEGFLISR